MKMAAVSRLADCTFDWQPVVYAGFEKVRPELLKGGTESKRLEELTSCNPWSAAWQCSRQTRDICFGSSKRIVRDVWGITGLLPLSRRRCLMPGQHLMDFIEQRFVGKGLCENDGVGIDKPLMRETRISGHIQNSHSRF
jgi:hypothetical protein